MALPLVTDTALALSFYGFSSAALVLASFAAGRKAAGERGVRPAKNVRASARSEMQFRDMFENAPEAMIVCSKGSGKILAANRRATGWLGYSHEELESGEVGQLIVRTENQDAGWVLSEPVAAKDLKLRKKNGELIDASVSVSEMSFTAGESLLFVIRDETERKKIERALQESERRFRELAESLPEGIFECTEDGDVIYGNKVAYEIFGQAENSSETFNVFDLLVPEQRERAMANTQARLRQEKKSVGSEYLVRRKDGSVFPVWVYTTVFYDKDGTQGLRGFFLDITEQKKVEEQLKKAKMELEVEILNRTRELRVANEQLKKENEERIISEEKLRESESRMRGVLSSLYETFIFIFNEKGQVERVWGDEKLKERYYLQNVKMEGTTLPDLFQCEKGEPDVRIIQDIFSTGESARVEYLFATEGGRVWHDLTLSPVKDGSDRVVMVVGFARDVTEHKLIEENQNKLIREIETANKELADFAYVVSHDLKAPLRAIGSLAYWLLEDYADKFDETGKSQVHTLIMRVKRLHDLIDGILQYSRIGRIKEDIVKVDLSELLSEVVEAIAPPKHVSVSIDGDMPVITGERTRIRQVFQNLLGNAVKYLDKEEGFVSVKCSDHGEYWVFAVEDNGPGIEERYFGKVFQIFQTLSPRDKVESTGVGLAVVKKIVEMYGGKVWIESTVGHGSAFYFSYPKNYTDKEW